MHDGYDVRTIVRKNPNVLGMENETNYEDDTNTEKNITKITNTHASRSPASSSCSGEQWGNEVRNYIFDER